jgi:uncharacterized SAM-binding protein YcdF (DUF218 family)
LARFDHSKGASYHARFFMTNAFDSDAQPRKRRLFLRILATLAGVLLAAALVTFLGIGRWLTIEDPLERAQSIVVLSGRIPIRAIEAARLYRAGYAPEIWLTRTIEPAASLQPMHIAYIGEDFYNTRILMHEGVPENAIRVLEQPIHNTADEVRVVAAELKRRGGMTAILVTTKAHTRRVRALWSRQADPRMQAVVRASPDDPFQPGHWWRTTGDALDVVRETLGLLNVWAGLPLSPSS